VVEKDRVLGVEGLLHGCDYNPEQWLDRQDILEKDIKLMKKANINSVSIGIFSWSKLEPEEGRFDFEWLDQVIEKLEKANIQIILATPSGAKPAWLASKHQEVLRVNDRRQRNLYGERHNHCFTSPIYRKFVKRMNEEIAKRYAKHPSVVLWHLSNEYGGDCHCDLCQDAFRSWLKARYGSLETLNKAWWTTFWSHIYTNWDQIESPSPIGENSLHGLKLDWNRFVTDQTIDFMEFEKSCLEAYNPDLPVTTNLMYFHHLNHFKLKNVLDIISWDSYPTWHKKDNVKVARDTAFWHDTMRSIKKQPFLLMESTPSQTNWQGVSKLKKPGMHILSSMQAVAHGSNSVQYFQWRKSRGGPEKFHGAVVDHCGKEDTRVFKEVSQLGRVLKEHPSLQHSKTISEVAIVYDWENRWALQDAQGPRNIGLDYNETVLDHYQTFWEKGISVDVVDMEEEISGYKIVIAPLLYMLRKGFDEKIRSFTASGGIFVTTYWSGIVDENDLCFLEEAPGKLSDVLGIWAEEIEGLWEGETKQVLWSNKQNEEACNSYKASELISLLHLKGAKALATFEEDFYKGYPALTVNEYGKGRAYYIASRNEESFYERFYTELMEDTNLQLTTGNNLSYGVVVTKRESEDMQYLIFQNYTQELQNIEEHGVVLEPFGVEVLCIKK
jgi:beta-galactosidase